ncbi:reverse transcriptase domain-containing protein [Tanacetum coccineum]
MTSETTRSKEIDETGIYKNKPPRFEQDVQEKPHDDETINERCSAILLDKLPLKEKDPRSFTIPCQVLEKHKEVDDLAADHLSRFENPHMEVLTKREITDKFFDEHLMVLKSKFKDDEPWYADFVNYIVGKEEPYAFKLCADNIMRRCVAGSETLKILAHCQTGPTSGHHTANVTAKKVYESGFYWPSVFKDANEFGVPKALISDKGTHFCNSQLEKALQRYAVTHKLSTEYHPQSNGQTEVTNMAIKCILKRSVGYNPKDWSKKLNDALIYKERTKKWHDFRLHDDKDFKVGDKVLLYNSRLKMYPGKLKSKWSGLNIVKTVYPYGVVDIIDKNRCNFKVNGQRLK